MAPSSTRPTRTRPLTDAFHFALDSGGTADLAGREPLDRRDRFLTLLAVYDLHTAPLPALGDRARFQHHPHVAELKARLEAPWLEELEREGLLAPGLADAATETGVVAALRTVARRDRLPEVYRWLASHARYAELVDFLAVEGGPDGGFDDLVALCQVGLSGSAKLELGKNYWDEMGQGDAAAVHTVLHEDLTRALDLPRIPRHDLPVEALERAALGGLLATNRWLQPELIGALGLLELQAGPRCRLVLEALERVGAPAAAFPFYAEHAEVDPVHGRDWVDKAVVPLVAGQPDWGPRIVRGAWWRSSVNARFFAAMHPAAVREPAAA